jgi:hypothetical protein
VTWNGASGFFGDSPSLSSSLLLLLLLLRVARAWRDDSSLLLALRLHSGFKSGAGDDAQ